MATENRLSPEEASERVVRGGKIDEFFEALSRGERPGAFELDVDYLRLVLSEAGANLNPERREEAVVSLAKTKYTEKHPNRRLGCEIVWDREGGTVVADFEEWAQEKSELTCPRFTFGGEPIEGSQSRGLKQLLADLTEMAIGGNMSVNDFVRRTDVRARFGIAYAEKKKMEFSGETGTAMYDAVKTRYKDLNEESKGLAMIPKGSLEEFWIAIRSGGIPR